MRERYAATIRDFNAKYGSQGYRLEIDPKTGARRTNEQQRGLQRALKGRGPAGSPANTWHTVGGAVDFIIYKDGVVDKGTTFRNAYTDLLAPIAKKHRLHAPFGNDVGHFQAVELPRGRGGAKVSDFIDPLSSYFKDLGQPHPPPPGVRANNRLA